MLNNKKVVNAWAMYDWANSVYSLVIASTIFPIYYSAGTAEAFHGKIIPLFGLHFVNTELFAYSITTSFLIIAVLSPILSGIADYSGKKKAFMRFFATLGSIASAGLYFFNGANIEYGLICSILASIGFAGSLVFYNAFLPEIVTPDRYDKVSAKGFAMGYIGSVLLMIFNLVMVLKPEIFHLKGSMPARISFLTVGAWWFGFSQYTFYYLPKTESKGRINSRIVSNGFKELAKVWQSLKYYPALRNFLLAFFFYDMGVQTVMYMATTFGTDELKLESSFLITAILVIQLVAIGGAYLFSMISDRKGNVFSLNIMVFLWVLVAIAAFFINSAASFLGMAFVVGMIMGGIQSLSRSTYSKLLPETLDHASYFSFYDVCDKLGLVIGTALFGFINGLTGNMRGSITPILLTFVIGFVLLQRAKSPKLSPQAVS
jgi:UMF1 family MFS transporter